MHLWFCCHHPEKQRQGAKPIPKFFSFPHPKVLDCKRAPYSWRLRLSLLWCAQPASLLQGQIPEFIPHARKVFLDYHTPRLTQAFDA